MAYFDEFNRDNFYNDGEFLPMDQTAPFQVKGLLEGMVDIIVTDQRKQLVDMEELYEALEVKTPFHKWIYRRIDNGGFEENEDFWTFLSESQGGRPKTKYYFLLDAAKEVAIMENNEMGKMFRKYFIDMEKVAFRFLGKEARRSLTDVICQYWKPTETSIFGKVTNELIYKPLFNKDAKQLAHHFGIRGNLRDGLDKEHLEKIEKQENQIIEFIVDFGLKYEAVKHLQDKKRINNFYGHYLH